MKHRQHIQVKNGRRKLPFHVGYERGRSRKTAGAAWRHLISVPASVYLYYRGHEHTSSSDVWSSINSPAWDSHHAVIGVLGDVKKQTNGTIKSQIEWQDTEYTGTNRRALTFLTLSHAEEKQGFIEFHQPPAGLGQSVFFNKLGASRCVSPSGNNGAWFGHKVLCASPLW